MNKIIKNRSFLNLMIAIMLLLIVSCGVAGSGTQKIIQNRKVKTFSVTLGAQSNASQGGFLNLSDHEVMRLAGATDNQKAVDIFYAYGPTVGAVLLTPVSNRITGFEGYFTDIVYSWSVFNAGRYLNLRHGKDAGKLYKNAKTQEDLVAAYNDGVKMVKSYADYNVYRNGPAKSLIHIETGDIIIFKSFDKDLYAIIRVAEYKPGYGGKIFLEGKVSL